MLGCMCEVKYFKKTSAQHFTDNKKTKKILKINKIIDYVVVEVTLKQDVLVKIL